MINALHDFLEILLVSLALGADSFSLALGVGLQGIHRDRAIFLLASIGVFHVFMTLLGLNAGLLIQGFLGQVAQWFSGFLLFGMGLHMAYTTLFQREEPTVLGSSTAAVMLFSAGVSIDALSVGFSLGLRSTAFGIASALTFGVTAALMCGVGLLIGKRAGHIVGLYGELVGAFILMGYGLHLLLS